MSNSKIPSSSSKNNKRKIIEKLPKYASKYLDKILTNLIIERIPDLQQSKSTEKWLAKVKLNILRKVSQSSKVLFGNNFQNIEDLKKDIQDLKDKIKKQTNSIKRSAIKEKNSTNISQIGIPTDNLITYVNGKFDAKTNDISEKLKEVAESLIQVNKDIHPRLESLNSTVQSVKPNIMTLLESYRKNNPQKVSSVTSSSTKSSSKKDNKSRRVTAPITTTKAPIQRLNELLDKN